MGVGEAVGWAALLLFVAAGAVAGVAALVAVIRDRRDLSATLAERIGQAAAGVHQVTVPPVWNLGGRHAVSGDTWPEHDEDAGEDRCWCRGCYEVEIELLQVVEVRELFAGLVDTPAMRDLADRARRWQL